MKAKHQRLTLAILALAAILGSSVLAMSALKDKASYFYSPSDLARDHVPDGRAVRLGGMVTTGSVRRAGDGVTYEFVVHDESGSVPVRFRGVPPPLFKEGSGVVADGSLAGGTFVATELLAKHDERYMPPKQDGGVHKSTTLKS